MFDWTVFLNIIIAILQAIVHVTACRMMRQDGITGNLKDRTHLFRSRSIGTG